jgi:3-dehydroquinate dehydratase-1
VLARGAALGRPVILSEHHLADTPDTPRLLRALEALQAAGAAAAKLVTVPCDPCDVTRFLDACLEARRTFLQVPLVAASGNQLGSYSRVVAPLYGIDLTFAAGPRGSVGGQLAIDDLRACRTVLGIP